MRKLFVSLVFGIYTTAIGFGQNPIDSARYLYNTYQQAISTGDFARSRELLGQILTLEQPLSGLQQAMIHNALGFVDYEMGHLREALEQYRIAEELVSEAEPSSLQVRISIHINLGVYYNGIGDYSNALEQNKEAVSLLSLIPEWDELSLNKISILLLNDGISLYHLGRYDEALEVLKECARIKEANKHPYLGSVYFNLARVYRSLEDAAQCRRYYLKSIEQWSREYDPDYYELANIYLHFGEYLMSRGETEQGFEYLQKALQNYRQNYGDIHPLTASCYESIARNYLDQSEYEKAVAYLQMALHSVAGGFEAEDPFSNPEIEASSHKLILLRILTTKAAALERTSTSLPGADEKTRYLEAALATNLLSRELLLQIQDIYSSSESRIFLNSSQKDLFTTGIRLNKELFEQTGHRLYSEEAFLTAVKGKSGELMFEMKSKEWLYLASLPDSMAIKATELKKQIDHLSNLIRIQALESNPDSGRMANWQKELFHTRDSFGKQMELLRTEKPEIGRFESANMALSLDQIRRNLHRKETLVEYFLSGPDASGKEQLFIFVVTKKACHVCMTPVDSTFYGHMETIMRNLHGFVPYLESRERFDSLKVALYGIYRTAVYPVESLFKGDRLIIVPDEMLSYIPFDALLNRLELDLKSDYAGAPYLLREYDISYLYNSQLINHHHSRAWRFPYVTAWLPGNAGSASGSYENLEGAVQEVQEILKLAKGRSIQKFMPKQDLLHLLQEPSILHLAVHSLATENSGSSPYFILDSTPDPMLANQIHDYEINALHLTTPMVVLSSCETAGGQLYRGEGIMSLSRSFLQAGAPSVVHSLWPVEDAKSKEIMVGFYGELKKGLSKSTALTRVKRQYLDQQPPFYTHPYYWAAYQITGDPAPVHGKRHYALIGGCIPIAFLIIYYLRRRKLLRRD